MSESPRAMRQRDGAPQPIDGDTSNWLDLSDLMEEVERGAFAEPRPPSLTEAGKLLWPQPTRQPGRAQATLPRTFNLPWQALVEELVDEARHCNDKALRAAMLFEAGRILIDRLGKPEAGHELLQRGSPNLAKLLTEDSGRKVVSLTYELGALEAVARDETQTADERAAAWIEFGQLCEERTPNLEWARDAYQRALELIPDHAVALTLVVDAGLLIEAPGTEKHLRRRLELLRAPRARLAALLDLADLLQDSAARREVLEQAHDTDPTEETALRRLIRGTDEDPARLGQLYRELAKVAHDPVSRSTALHLAFLTLSTSGNTESLDDLVRELADPGSDAGEASDVLAPLSEVALGVQKRIACDEDGRPTDIAILERLWKCLDDPREQALVREQLARLRLEMLDDPSTDPGTRRKNANSENRTAIYDALENDLRFCLVHLPEHRWISEALATVLEHRQDLPGLVLHLQEWSRKQSAGPGRAEILLRLGELHERLRSDLPRSVEVYELAVAEDPDNANCLRALGRAYEKMRRWPQAIGALQRQANETDDAHERLAALRRIAAMAEQELNDVDLAIASLEQVANTDPDDLFSLYQLAALCRAHGRQGVLLNTLQLLVDRLDDDSARTAVLVELGEVQELHLKQRAPARECYERALTLSPGYTPALRALARLYRDNGDLESLMDLLTSEADPITDPALLALKAARVAADELGNPDRAIDELQRAYQANPDLASAREQLLQSLTATGRIQTAYDILRAQTPPTTAPLLADHHYRLGLLAEALGRSQSPGRGLQHEDAALQHHRAAMATQVDHGLAFERSRRLLVAHNDFANLIRLLENQLEHSSDQTKPFLLVQLARLHMAMPEGEEAALVAYEQAYQASGGDPLVRREFELVLRKLDGHRTLPALYLTAARRSDDTHFKATLYVEATELLLATGLPEDRELACKSILQALRDDPGNPYAVRHLERLLGEPEFTVSIRDAVGARAVRAQSDAERALFYLESAELLELAGDREQAKRAYLAAQDALPGLANVPLSIERFSSVTVRTEPVTEAKTSIHVLMAEARDATARGATGDGDASVGALEILREILQREPEHRDAIALTRALTSQLDDPTPVIHLLASVFRATQRPELRYELGLFLGENVGNAQESIHYLSTAAAAKPDGRQALRGLVNAYRRMGDDARAAEATERLLALFDPAEPSAIDLRMGIANYLGGSAETLSRALEHAQIVLDTRSDDPRAVTLMTDLLERAGRYLEAARVLDRLTARERNNERLHDIYLRKARLLAEVPGHDTQALQAVERAAVLDPGNRETIGFLVDLFHKSGQTERIATFLQPMRAALLSNITRGAISLRDLGLLGRVAHGTNPDLAETADRILHAIEPSIVQNPPPDPRPATRAGLERILETPSLRNALTSPREPGNLQVLLGQIEVALVRLRSEFPVLEPHQATPLPPSADPKDLAPLMAGWADLFGLSNLELGACAPHNAVLILPESSVLRLGSNLWMQGDPIEWRGLLAVAFARYGLGASRARALSPMEVDLLLAACFEMVEVFNAIIADPDQRRLRDLASQLGKLLNRRQKKQVEQLCQSLSGETFAPAETARATLATDLRLATVFSGDPASVLSAACLLDGVAGGSLKTRISRARSAQELLAFLLSDDYATLRAAVVRE